MYVLLLILLLLDGLFMSVVVLLQSGKGGGLAAMGGGQGTDNLIGGRQAATLLTKATWVSSGLFLFLALVLSVMSSRRDAQSGSVLRGVAAPVQQQAPAQPLDLTSPATTGDATLPSAAPTTGGTAPATTGQ